MAFNPFLTAHPAGALPPSLAAVNRMSFLGASRRSMFRLRFEVSADQKTAFPHNALHTPAEKLAVSVVQGFGRFGPFGPAHSDSVKRFELAAGLGRPGLAPLGRVPGPCLAAFRGCSQCEAGAPPTAWAVLVHFGVAFAVVTLYLPMAWDRYLLPIQAPAALLASGVAVAAAECVGRPRQGSTAGGRRCGWRRRPEVWVFLVLLGSYAYFWQSRDWNCASRLMLTYALVDRGTVAIDGLEDHTHDRAKVPRAIITPTSSPASRSWRPSLTRWRGSSSGSPPTR